MKKGFFSSIKYQSKDRIPTNPQCGLCGLYKGCISPKMPPSGNGKKKILFIAEAPGEEEDRQNTQLIGKSGQYLRRVLRRLSIDLDRDCWKTNAVICRREGNKAPEDFMINACRPNIMKVIRQREPNVIILLGAVAIKSLLSPIYKKDIGLVAKWGGCSIPCHNPNSWIVPTYHPSFLLRKKSRVLDRIFEEHLRIAIAKSKSKPYKIPPDYKSQVDVIMNPIEAARIIREMIKRGGPISFDYETNCLKPDGRGIEIISCSVCWQGKKTIAYPWEGEAIEATDLLLKSSLPKIAANLKFEDRWTRAKLQHPVRNWFWDTMIAAHVLDNSREVTGLKFQAFVLLGMEPYDEHVKPYLQSTKKSRFNRIREMDLRDLLIYNGLDSLLTYKVAMIQMQQFQSRKEIE